MPKTVSIAMTTYNGEKYLREQLDSIYRQTKKPVEVIVCDDNSIDGTVSILDEYKNSQGLKYFINKPGLGVNANFYKAISLCSSDYIALSDQDDIWLPNKIETSFKKITEIDNGQPCVVSCQCDDINAVGDIIYRRQTSVGTEGYSASLLGIGIGQGCTMMINRPLKELVLSLITRMPQFNDIIYDAFISYIAAIFGRKYNLKVSLMQYRHHDTNVLGRELKSKPSFVDRIKNHDTFVGFIPDKRIEYLSMVFDLLGKEMTGNQSYGLLSSIHEIYMSNSFISKLRIILLIKEYTYWARIKIVFFSSVLYILKRLVRVNNCIPE